MCGRFSLTASADAIAEAFHLDAIPNWQPRYNIAPKQQIPAIVGNREFRTLRWGLIPSWSKDASIGNRLINARAETLAEKPSFRDAFRQRRCLIVTDGFYEWKKTEKGKKQPFYFQLETGEPFAFAGLWERWKTFETCTIITTEANSLMADVHDRMPVMLGEEGCDRWLDPKSTSQELQSILRPYPDAAMAFYPIGLSVNSPSNDTPDCIQPLPYPSESKSLAGKNSDQKCAKA
jgi:putative SOS response-associated peptidase YedK